VKILYDQLSAEISSLTTKTYSTSFSLGIHCLHHSIRKPIYQIYGFVRVADEIVDSFHEYDKELLLKEFEEETYHSIHRRISTNPILNSFQEAVNTYKIDHELISSFLTSMKMDLESKTHDEGSYNKYIYGSAEVVGLMCLYVFVEGDQKEYERLKPEAMKLGSAFQKINFLRDIKADGLELGRTYFPDVDLAQFNDEIKRVLIKEIEVEFDEALNGIRKLPKKAQFGVYVAYIYYRDLSDRIKGMSSSALLNQRASVPNSRKLWLLVRSYLKYNLLKI
jgi:15-cis-phytoene synthase